jgi:hypothetical protein
MIVMISVGISYAIWAAMKTGGPVSTAQTSMAWTPTVIGIVFAFVKINGISLLRIVLLSIERLDKPATRIWIPRQGIHINIVTKAPRQKKNQAVQKKTEQKGNTQIGELSRVLDQGPAENELENDEQQVQKPVNRNRIKAEKREKPVDDIAPPFIPPPSHA